MNKKINDIGGGLSTPISNFLDSNYDADTADFIKLILMNIKTSHTWVFYKQTVDLGIVWLFCVSGFHISFISRWIRKIPKVGNVIAILFVAFYWYLLGFTFSIARILFKNLFRPLFKKFEINLYDQLGIIGIGICLLNPSCLANYGFVMSFIICISTYFIIGWELNNKVIQSILINVFAFVVIIPFVIEMNSKISLLTFVNAFLFSYASPIIFCYYLLFSWLPFIELVHKGVMQGVFVLVGNISFANIFIYSPKWPSWGQSIYYASITAIGKGLYLIVFNNKI